MAAQAPREPSPLRSAIKHSVLSFATVGFALTAMAGGIHLWGSEDTSSPVRQIALFETKTPAITTPQLKTRLASSNAPARQIAAPVYRPEDTPQPFITDAMIARGETAAPDLGIDYVDGVSRVVRVADNSNTNTPDVAERPTVRINGISVSSGQSWQESRSTLALPHAPVAAVSERTPVGTLPKISDDGRTPAGVYARPFANTEGRPTVSIILGGLGINRTHTRSAIDELPPEVTLSFAPGTRDLQGWIDQARAAGHEVLLEVPLEAYELSSGPAHPQSLTTAMQEAQIDARLSALMASASGYFGLTNYQGGRFLRSPESVTHLARLTAARGLAFVEDGSLPRSAMDTVTTDAPLRFRRANFPIDTQPHGGDIQERLLELETLAIDKGSSVGSGFAYPVTIDILKAWTDSLPAKGIVLAPASAATHTRPSATTGRETASIAPQAGGQADMEAVDTTG
ncbi:divergent polysaccharide deacetylase family protein [Henriciella barbarensis]|uniref:Divergent polysaccharide deacetylase family protein n=1 Tax=Henriciella barbarensis TaxID=86342 RepID=A0A399QYH8_9PROT|nr:divergent polysaccharide deacetylase family protein [Henriciella barbarensis]RIJ24166.1 divergent polysaccharide deacetylase family protein [Henriciella barbarensis]